MNNNRLSYSQLRLYTECGQKFKYSYLDKIRETVKSGALFFGTAFDSAITSVLKNVNANEYEVFDKSFTTQELNGKQEHLVDSLNIVYASSDFDSDLLKEEDTAFLRAKAEEIIPTLFKECKENALLTFDEIVSHKKQKAFKHWPEAEQKWYNIANWLSLRRKGHLMLQAHREKVLPNIKKVYSTQRKIELDNRTGDTLVGYPDAVVQWVDGRTIIFDYKTSSIEYDKDSVLCSTQLTIYSHALDITTCGYLVFRKQIFKNKIKVCSVCQYDGSGARHKTCSNETSGKRCGGEWTETIRPEVQIQVIIDDIPARTKEIVIENIESANLGIHNGVFTRNFNACKQSYGTCPYFGLCFRGDMHGLLQMSKDKK